MSETMYAGKMPILALRGLAVFPDQTIHFDVGRAKSVKALEAAMKQNQTLLLIPQKDILVDDPKLVDLYSIGTVAKVKQVLKAHGDNLRVLVTGLCRARIADLEQTEPYLYGQVCAVPETEIVDSPRNTALRREATMLFGLYLDAADHNAQSVQMRLMSTNNTGFVADTIAQNSGIEFPEKCKLLSQLNPSKRLENVVRLLRHEVEVLKLEALIQERTKASMDQNQKDYYLREQMKAIREELGEGDDLDE